MTIPSYPPPIDLVPLEVELEDGGFPVPNGLGMDDSSSNHVYTYDAEGVPEDLPAEAQPIVDAYLSSARTAQSQAQLAVNAIGEATTVAGLRSALLQYVTATSGLQLEAPPA